MTKEKCSIRLVRLSEEHTAAFKEEMQEAFQHGFMAYYKDDNQWQVLPDSIFSFSVISIVLSLSYQFYCFLARQKLNVETNPQQRHHQR